MEFTQQQLLPVLSRFNPWWNGKSLDTLHKCKRSAFTELYNLIMTPQTHRALAVSGSRQIGKTTLILQLIKQMLDDGVPAANIVYITMDHPILKLAGIDRILEAWRELEVPDVGLEYVFIDEIQNLSDWGTWIKHQVDFDFSNTRRIIFTGSAMSMESSTTESAVGRWHTYKLGTLSFYEYLMLKGLVQEDIPSPKYSLSEVFEWKNRDFICCAQESEKLLCHFHEYLLRGGFPQTALINNVEQAQSLIREDIVDKVLKRDMTAFYGVRRILDLENTFLYLCMHDGGILDMPSLCSNLGVKRPTAQSFIELMESIHMVKKLAPYGYGKDILRARFKIYLSDASIAPAVLLLGKGLLEDPVSLGQSVETAAFKHLSDCMYRKNIRFSYWRNKKEQKVDFISTTSDGDIPFEVKYKEQYTDASAVPGLLDFIKHKNTTHGYVLTKTLSDFGVLRSSYYGADKVMRIPAMLFCLWSGKNEVHGFTL